MTVDLERLVPFNVDGPLSPLFCVHAVSGSAFTYLEMARLLGADQPVYGIEAPGFDGDREPVRSLPALAAEYVEILQAFRPEGDLRLLGWSFGGVVAFDMAQRLTATGRKVAQVILIDSGLPWVADLPPEKEIQRRFVHDLIGIAGVSGIELAGVFADHPDDVDSAAMFAAVEESGILPEEFDAELLCDRYAVFRAHIAALFAFEVTETYHGPVTHIMSAASEPRYMRWDRVATDLVEHVLDGDHHSIWRGASLVEMTDLVRQALRSVDCRTG